MLYYLDSVIVIYAVEGNAADKKRAKDHLDALEQAGHRFAISELTRTECLVRVFGPGGNGCERSASVGGIGLFHSRHGIDSSFSSALGNIVSRG